MLESRREALRFFAGAAGLAAFGAWLANAQDPSQPDGSRAAPRPGVGRDTDPVPGFESKRTKAVLEQNQKDMKKNIERLFQLATELKDEVEKTDATAMLSL